MVSNFDGFSYCAHRNVQFAADLEFGHELHGLRDRQHEMHLCRKDCCSVHHIGSNTRTDTAATHSSDNCDADAAAAANSSSDSCATDSGADPSSAHTGTDTSATNATNANAADHCFAADDRNKFADKHANFVVLDWQHYNSTHNDDDDDEPDQRN
jgi:hypothetical protein